MYGFVGGVEEGVRGEERRGRGKKKKKNEEKVIMKKKKKKKKKRVNTKNDNFLVIFHKIETLISKCTKKEEGENLTVSFSRPLHWNNYMRHVLRSL